MFHSARSNLDVRRIADAIASAPDLDVAFDQLVVELAAELGTRACVFRRGDRGWALVSQNRGGMGVSLADLLLVLNAVPHDGDIAAVNLAGVDRSTWTSLKLNVSDAPVMVLLAGDWTQGGVLGALAVTLSFALRSVEEHQRRRRAEQAVVDGYVMGRNLSRGAGLDQACQRIVQHVSRSMHVDRVTLALHEPDDDRIASRRPRDRLWRSCRAFASNPAPGSWVTFIRPDVPSSSATPVICRSRRKRGRPIEPSPSPRCRC
jgi:hypothetical protein